MIRYLLFISLSVFIAAPAWAGEPIPGAGDFLQLALPATALGSLLLNKDTDGGMQYTKSALTCLALTQGLKMAIHEQRPNGHDNNSFPSGHTSAAFFGASFIQRRYGWKYGAPAYLLASYVGWSRVEKKAHYVHDVLAGAAIGVFSSYLFTTHVSKNVDIVPQAGKDYLGIGVNIKW